MNDRHPVVQHAAVVLAILLALLVGGVVVKHIASSFEDVSTGLDTPAEHSATHSTPQTEQPVSMSPDDVLFLEGVTHMAPALAEQTPDADLIGLALTVRDGWFGGLTVKRLVKALVAGGLPRPESDSIVRLVVAVYCHPVSGNPGTTA